MAEKKFVTERVKNIQEVKEVKNENVNDDNISILTVSIDDLQYNPYQSRFRIDEDSIKTLKASIEQEGLINPITVVKRDKNYVIASGHRRFEALKSLGFKTIKVIIKEMDDIKLSSSNISENTQRKNISPIEIALAYEDLRKLTGSSRAVAETLKISEATVSNYLAMATKLSENIINSLKSNTDLKSVNFLTKLTALVHEQQEIFFNKVKEGKIKIGTAISEINKIIKAEKQGKTHFEQKVKSVRNKATLTIDGNVLKIKGNVISFHQNEKEELLNKLQEVLNEFYSKYDKKIEAGDKRLMNKKKKKDEVNEDVIDTIKIETVSE